MKIPYKKKEDKLAFFQELYETAKSKTSDLFEELNKHLLQYKGDDSIDGSPEKALVVRNITYELIESQLSSYIPNPAVEPGAYNDANGRNAKTIEAHSRKIRNRLPFEEMNDLDERYCNIYGGSVWLVEWDESITTHDTVGAVKVTCLSPLDFVPQPYIYDVQEMEYCFVKFEATLEDIERRYGITLEAEGSLTMTETGDNDGTTATLVVCYYRNDDGKICQYVWSGDEVILDIDDYYARKRYVCKSCGKRKEICTCENGDYELLNEEYEELNEDVQTSHGVIPARSIVLKDGVPEVEYKTVDMIGADGSPMFDTSSGIMMPLQQTVEIPKTEPTRLPYYVPDLMPIVIRKNTSQEKSLFGQSDCAFIRHQQQAINKVESRILQKLLRASVTPVVPEDATITLNNSVFGQVIRLKPGESMGQYGTVDTVPDLSQDIAEAERLYEHAKRILGINNSFQGQYDSSAQSGYAKQLQIQQATGRLESKRRMKNAAYAQMDHIIFQLYLAYSDEPRPASYVDGLGRVQNVDFNRYDFIERDEAGEYYYNDEYLFSADASVDPEQSREYIWELNLNNFKNGMLGDPTAPETMLRYWLNQERAHYPYARENVEYFKALIEQQQQMASLEERATAAEARAAELEGELNSHIEYENEMSRRINE